MANHNYLQNLTVLQLEKVGREKVVTAGGKDRVWLASLGTTLVFKYVKQSEIKTLQLLQWYETIVNIQHTYVCFLNMKYPYCI